jgi:branched-chain amino acid transport system substrate-binding protein
MNRMRERPRRNSTPGPGFHAGSVLVLCIALVALTGSGCKEKDPIKVGFSGCLTGRLSDLGVSGRNGTILAVEEKNRIGGIAGRPIELIVKNDRHEPETAIRVDRELIAAGVAAIVGHMTSSMSMAALPVLNEAKLPLVSPTTSTNKLADIDDYLFRVVPPNRHESNHLADYARDGLALGAVGIVYDLSNPVYTEGWQRNFTARFEEKGGKVVFSGTFTSGDDAPYLALIQSLRSADPDGAVVVGGAIDTAMICQQLRKLGENLPLVAAGWSETTDLIRHGGAAVEGLVFSSMFDKKSREPAYRAFVDRFRERFGGTPDFAAACAYEAARLLLKALESPLAETDLKKALLAVGTFDGVQGPIHINRYGDPDRQRFLVTVRDGQFAVLEPR